MIKKKINIYISSVIFILAIYSNGFSQWFIDVETGPVFSGYNNVSIPKETGTEFSLSKDLKTDSTIFFRLRLGYQMGSKHTFSVLIAP